MHDPIAIRPGRGGLSKAALVPKSQDASLTTWVTKVGMDKIKAPINGTYDYSFARSNKIHWTPLVCLERRRSELRFDWFSYEKLNIGSKGLTAGLHAADGLTGAHLWDQLALCPDGYYLAKVGDDPHPFGHGPGLTEPKNSRYFIVAFSRFDKFPEFGIHNRTYSASRNRRSSAQSVKDGTSRFQDALTLARLSAVTVKVTVV